MKLLIWSLSACPCYAQSQSSNQCCERRLASYLIPVTENYHGINIRLLDFIHIRQFSSQNSTSTILTIKANEHEQHYKLRP